MPKHAIGSRVEFSPTSGALYHDPHRGEPALVVGYIGGKVRVQFADGETADAHGGHLTELPTEAEIEAAKVELLRLDVAKKKSVDRGYYGERPGNPHTFTDGPRRAGTTPGGRD